MKTIILLALIALSAPEASADHRHYGYRGGGGYCGTRAVRVYAPRYSYGYRGGYGYGGGYAYGGRYCGGSYSFWRPSTWFYASAVPLVSFNFARTYAPARSYEGEIPLEAGVQKELRRRGYYRGAVDGDIGPESRAAIRGYQRDHGLGMTGRIDSTLLRSLGV